MPDIQNLITDNLDVWTSAIQTKSSAGRGTSNKISLHGIKKLRELILELAVRGKLVPQDSNDEPASVLLKKIAAKKKQLIKDKKIKKQKPLPPINDEEKPFKPPKGWEWARFQDITVYIQRGKGPKYDDSGNVKVISQKCVQWSGFDIEKARYVDDKSLNAYQEERFLQPRDLLWNSTGTGTVGRINILDYVDKKKLVADSHVTVIRPLIVDSSFIWTYIAAPGVQSRIEPDHKKSLVSGTTNQVELNASTVTSLIIPIPPLVEQHRIVAKVDELMALCDQLEQQTEDGITAHQILVETLLATLTQSQSAEELTQNWNRIAEHFDTLFTTEPSIDQLKQTVLQLAVMGKLVPQDPNDEPASILLKKLAAEKEGLVKEGKIKKQKPLPPISDDEKLFELPQSWEWVRLGGATNYGVTDKAEPSDVDAETWVLELEDVEKQTSKLLRKVNFKERQFKSSKNRFHNGDVLYGKLRPYLDKVLIADASGVCTTEMIPVRAYYGVSPEFLRLLMKTPDFVRYANDSTHGMNLPRLGTDKARLALLPLAPEVEQHRIVAKVDELMALCDQLKAHLNDAQTTQIHLADTIVERATA